MVASLDPQHSLCLRLHTVSTNKIQARTIDLMYCVRGTVDGRNPAPVDRLFIPSVLWCYTSRVVYDLFHQQYEASGLRKLDLNSTAFTKE